jgi:hypothetical protein
MYVAQDWVDVSLHVIKIWRAGKFASSTQAFERARPMMEHIELIAI